MGKFVCIICGFCVFDIDIEVYFVLFVFNFQLRKLCLVIERCLFG